MIYLVDIDGTLADLTHRLHFIEQKPADWDSFFAACPDDKPIHDVIDTINQLGKSAVLIMVTGRSEKVRVQTEYWLNQYISGWQGLYMRREGDHRQDDVIKGELLDQILSDKRIGDLGQITGVFEDRQQVVDMYRARGLRVFQVAPGNF
jgi:hypothetical protein